MSRAILHPSPGRKSRSGKLPDDCANRRSLERIFIHDPILDEELVEGLWNDPDEVFSNAANQPRAMLKDGDRSTVIRLTHGGNKMVLKRFNLKGPLHTGVHTLMRSRARWCWLNGRLLRANQVLTPIPLAYVENRKLGVLRFGSYLLTQYVSGKSLMKIVRKESVSQDDMRHYAEQLAAIWQALGQLRIGYGDMKATNFIIDSEKQLWMIDLDGMRVYRSNLLFRRERRNDLASFMQNWRDQPDVAEFFRSRLGLG